MKLKTLLAISLLMLIFAAFLEFYNPSNVKIERKIYSANRMDYSYREHCKEYNIVITTWTTDGSMRNYWHKSWETKYMGSDLKKFNYETKYEAMMGTCPYCKKEIWVSCHYGNMFYQMGHGNATSYHGVYFHEECFEKFVNNLSDNNRED